MTADNPAGPDQFSRARLPRDDDRITLRFMSHPQDAASSGRTIAAGSVLEWIDAAAYACAVGWSRAYCVTAYVGNIHYTRPIPPGSLIAVHARIIHTGRSSMHVHVQVEASDVAERRFHATTDCILVFVAVDDHKRPVPIRQWEPATDSDHELNRLALERVPARKEIKQAMDAQEYTDAGTAPRTVLRFLAPTSAVNWGGNAFGGTVMRWIDEAAFACATGWSSKGAVAAYSGGIHFLRPIHIGDLVEIEARLIHTGSHSMHISVHVRSADTATPHDMRLTTLCMSIYVAPGQDGRALPVKPLPLVSEEDRRLDAHALDLIARRKVISPIPAKLVH